MAVADDQQLSAVLDEALIAVGDRPALRGWRCASCGRLAFGIKRICPTCGANEGRETRLEGVGALETWTKVFGQSAYVIGYGLVGDGEDDQRVRVFGPVEADGEGDLVPGLPVEIRFRVGTTVWGDERVHHFFAPEAR